MIRWLFRRRKAEHPAGVEEAKQVRDQQFDDWQAVQDEVERVQKLVIYGPPPARPVHHR